MKKKKTKINLQSPTSWIELTERQIVFVAKLFDSGIESAEELALRCFFRFTGLRPYKIKISNYEFKQREKLGLQNFGLYRYKRNIVEIDKEIIFAFAEKLKFLAETPGLMRCQSRIAGLWFNDSQLWKTTFEEYCMADRYYRVYSKSKVEEHLCCMIAVLYRHKNETYRDELIKDNKLRIRAFSSRGQRLAIFLWWTGIKIWLKEKYPDLFSAAKNTVEFGNTDADDDDSESIMNMLYSITEGKAHENKEVYKTPVHEVLHALNTKAKNINEINSKLKK